MNDVLRDCVQKLNYGALEDVNYNSITIVYQGEDSFDNSITVRFPKGLTEEVYNAIAPSVTDREKAELALGVIGWMRYSTAPIEFCDLRMALYGQWDAFEEWCLEQLAVGGFDTLADKIEDWWVEYRQAHPPTWRGVPGHPRWDRKNHILSFGDIIRVFKTHKNSPVLQLLNEFQRRRWRRSVTLSHLDPDQIHEAAKLLRKKTEGYIWWKESKGKLIWLPQQSLPTKTRRSAGRSLASEPSIAGR